MICATSYRVKRGGIEVDARNVHRLLQRVLPDFASYGDVELLQRVLILGVRKIKIIDVRKLDWEISEKGECRSGNANVARVLLWQASARRVQI
jgi:hypothetical protein